MADGSAATASGSVSTPNADSGVGKPADSVAGKSVGAERGNSGAPGKTGSDGSTGGRNPGEDGGASRSGKRGRGRPAGKRKPAGAASINTGAKPAVAAPTPAPTPRVGVGVETVTTRQAFGQQICFIHAVIANATQQPLIALAAEEGEALAGALLECAKHLNMVVDPRTAAFVSLGVTAASIYGARIYAFQSQRAQRSAPPPVATATSAPASDVDVMANATVDVLNNAARVHAGIAPSVSAATPSPVQRRGNDGVQPSVMGRRPYDFSRAA